MNTGHLACMAALCLGFALVACTRQDSVFSVPPTYHARSELPKTSLADCIALRLRRRTRDFHRTRENGEIQIRGKAFFSGVTIGVRVRSDGATTLVEFFQRRFADPLYVGLVRGCLRPALTGAP